MESARRSGDLTGLQLGNYRLLRLLGKGGSAAVYLGRHVYLKRQAAIKVLHVLLTEGASPHFLAEAQTIAQLQHPHIVQIFDYSVGNDIPFLVMDYLPLGSLRQRHPRGSRLPLAQVVSYVQQVASALSYAQQHRLIHRDVKPENMLLHQDGRVLLSDFGLAMLAPSATAQMAVPPMAGTIPYMAPEQCEGRPRLASDQYALAIVAYEWLCGERPFQGTPLEIATQHLVVSPAPLRAQLPALPLAVEQVILRALAKDPAQRFEHVAGFAQALMQASMQVGTDLAAIPVSDSATVVSPPLSPTCQPAFAPSRQERMVRESDQTVTMAPSPARDGHEKVDPISTRVASDCLASCSAGAFADPVVSRRSLSRHSDLIGGHGGGVDHDGLVQATRSNAARGATRDGAGEAFVPPTGHRTRTQQAERRKSPLWIAGLLGLALLVVGGSIGGWYAFPESDQGRAAHGSSVGTANHTTAGQAAPRNGGSGSKRNPAKIATPSARSRTMIPRKTSTVTFPLGGSPGASTPPAPGPITQPTPPAVGPTSTVSAVCGPEAGTAGWNLDPASDYTIEIQEGTNPPLQYFTVGNCLRSGNILFSGTLRTSNANVLLSLTPSEMSLAARQSGQFTVTLTTDQLAAGTTAHGFMTVSTNGESSWSVRITIHVS